MIDGTSALQLNTSAAPVLITDQPCDAVWTPEQHYMIVQKLLEYGCKYIKDRDEYTLLKEIVVSGSPTEEPNFRQTGDTANPVNTRAETGGVISPLCGAIVANDTDTTSYSKPFLAPLNVQKTGSIADVIPSFKVIQSDSMSINIGFDTEFQDYRDGSGKNRRVLSLQMTIAIGETLIRYFFLVDPRYQEVTAEGGMIPLKYCLADILDDLKKCYFPEFPLVRKEGIIYKNKEWKGHGSFKVVDFKAMKDFTIPITIICHTGKADISVFRRSKYDIDLLRKLGEIQGGWMTTENVRFKAENDRNYNYYWPVNLCVRDTLGLTPADNKSLKALGKVINRPKIDLPNNVIEHMAAFAVSNPVEYYKYAVNDADIVVSFCSELFRCNRQVQDR